MPAINHKQLNKLLEHYMLIVAREHGDAGVEVLKSIMETLLELYNYVDPEISQGPIVVFKTVDPTRRPLLSHNALNVVNLRTLSQDAHSSFTLQILDTGQYLLWNRLQPNLVELAEEAVVYLYQDQAEYFFAGSEKAEVPKIVASCSSVFSRKRFSDLIEALEYYRTDTVRHSTCYIFRNVWHDHNRIFFINAPEHIMRDSLTQFLRNWLRGDVDVHPEQNVDETRPIDIKITWLFSNRLALIEIKWLGKSKNEQGDIANTHGQSRVQKGAKQLADYLDLNLQYSPSSITRGYLVIVDGRRHRTNKDTQSLDRKRGYHYQDAEIELNPKYHEIRGDFEKPIRMFAEPICKPD
jgi:hypothetical protein